MVHRLIALLNLITTQSGKKTNSRSRSTKFGILASKMLSKGRRESAYWNEQSNENMTIYELEKQCESVALKQLDKDLIFSGCKPLAKLSDDDKRVIINAFKQFTSSAVKRTIDECNRVGYDFNKQIAVRIVE